MTSVRNPGEYVKGDYGRAAAPGQAGGQDVAALALRQDARPAQAGVGHPTDNAHQDYEAGQAVGDDGGGGDEQGQGWDRELDVGHAHEDHVEPSAHEASQNPHGAAHQRGQAHHPEGHLEGGPDALGHPGQDVSAQGIGAEQVAGRARPGQYRGEVLLRRAPAGDGAEQADQEHEDQDAGACLQ